jgi:hypothetical protein
MYESGYYPSGAEYDSNAPWNQSDESDNVIDIQVTCSNTLSKDFVLTTNQCDNEGNLSDDCNLTEEFFEQQYSAKQALDLAVKLANLIFKKGLTDTELRVTAGEVLDACSDWNEDELEVVNATEL